jgi:hypothetical protein
MRKRPVEIFGVWRSETALRADSEQGHDLGELAK